jgi:hypothetical protein
MQGYGFETRRLSAMGQGESTRAAPTAVDEDDDDDEQLEVLRLDDWLRRAEQPIRHHVGHPLQDRPRLLLKLLPPRCIAAGCI